MVVSCVKIICAFTTIEKRKIKIKVKRFYHILFFTNIRRKVLTFQTLKIQFYSRKNKKAPII